MLDLILANGEVIDGTGRPRFRADVAIEGAGIAAVAPRIDTTGVPRIELRVSENQVGFAVIVLRAWFRQDFDPPAWRATFTDPR